MLKITIPKPCHEDWNKMTENQEGRHCNSCMKTVIDFTRMNDDEVRNFLVSKKEEHVCGRFQNKQLQRIQLELPADIYYLEMPLWKKFLVACLVVFSTTLFSCDIKHADATSGKIEKLSNGTDSINNLVKDEIRVGGFFVSNVSIRVAPTIDTVTFIAPPIIMGDFEIRPIDDTSINTQEVIIGKPAYQPIDSIPLKQSAESIKGEILFVPDSTKNDNKCPAGI